MRASSGQRVTGCVDARGTCDCRAARSASNQPRTHDDTPFHSRDAVGHAPANEREATSVIESYISDS